MQRIGKRALQDEEWIAFYAAVIISCFSCLPCQGHVLQEEFNNACFLRAEAELKEFVETQMCMLPNVFTSMPDQEKA